MAKPKLTKKQQLFIKEYLVDLNATKAAVRAGYSEVTARQQGQRMLSNVDIKNAIQEAMDKRSERTEITADYVLNRLVEIDNLDIADILSDNGAVKSIKEWPEVWRKSINGVDIQELLLNDGDIASSIVKKIKFPDKLRNLELLGKHTSIGAFTDKQEITTISYEERLKQIALEVDNERL